MNMSFISNIRTAAALAFVLATTAGCVEEQFGNSAPGAKDNYSGSLMTKVINSSINAEESQLLVCLDKEAAIRVEN